MSVLTDVMDRLTGLNSLQVQVTELVKEQREIRNVMFSQQRELAELRGQLKALIQMQGQALKK
jgi:hypothetical protein